MAEIQRKLHRLDFPACSREALQYIVHSCRNPPSQTQSIPGLDAVPYNYSLEVCQEFILFNPTKKGANKVKLRPIQELQLLDLICTCLQETPEAIRRDVLKMIFGGTKDEKRINLMTKLISMALSISSASVLNCISAWMTDIGCKNKYVTGVIEKLIQDYCSLFPESTSSFQKLPEFSGIFACNFITSVTALYNFKDVSKFPTLNLMQHITDWISKDPCLCCQAVKQGKSGRFSQSGVSPLSGLVNWTVFGLVSYHVANCSSGKTCEKNSQLFKLLSQLHIGILMSLNSSNHPGKSLTLLSASEVMDILANLVQIFRHKDTKKEDLLDKVLMAIERFAQVIQVAVVTRSMKITKGDLKQIEKLSEGLPPNRLLHIVLRHQEISNIAPMDTS